MNKSEAGRLGAKATKMKYGLERCSECGRFKPTSFYKENGGRGGEETLNRYGSGFFAKIGKLGGRGNKKGG